MPTLLLGDWVVFALFAAAIAGHWLVINRKGRQSFRDLDIVFVFLLASYIIWRIQFP
jgi:hypothetical protein